MRFLVYAFALVGSFILIGCDRGKEANLQKLEQIRLHFAGFTKSKSGAT